MASLLDVGTALRQLWLFRPGSGTAAPALVGALDRELPLGGALRQSTRALARAAVTEAAVAFDSGAVALLIVDVRDALRRQLTDAGLLLQARGEHALAQSLAVAAQRINEDTFTQHLVNAVLSASELYTEAQPFEPGRRVLAKVELAVAELLGRSLCVLLTRSDAARTMRNGALPAFSWPPSTVVGE